jgi:predicted Rossmann-fold nucleotide-binding protein
MQDYKTIERVAELRGRLSLDRCVLQGLDLRHEELPWADIAVTRRTFFFGCQLPPAAETALRERGAIFFPRFGELPYDPYRRALYDSAELMRGYDGHAFEATASDQKIYGNFRRSKKRRSVVDQLAQRLHDHSVSDALERFLQGSAKAFASGIVGIMGGHQVARDSAEFREVARLGHRLARAGFLVLTGGGPGAMEAGNLGAFLAPHRDEAVIDDAVGMLRDEPHAGPPVPSGYFLRAQDVIGRFAPASAAPWGFRLGESLDAGVSLAIPTWTYGHEPSNLFASHIAKLFQNGVREEGLVTIANAGLVFAPGKAGTLQEVFTDAVQNYYADHTRDILPMAFWPRAYWTETIPVLDTLRKLADAGGKRFKARVAAFDDIGEIVNFLLDPPHIF